MQKWFIFFFFSKNIPNKRQRAIRVFAVSLCREYSGVYFILALFFPFGERRLRMKKLHVVIIFRRNIGISRLIKNIFLRTSYCLVHKDSLVSEARSCVYTHSGRLEKWHFWTSPHITSYKRLYKNITFKTSVSLMARTIYPLSGK